MKYKKDATVMRFVDGEALLNHSLIRIGFRESWERMIGAEYHKTFFNRLKERINDIVSSKGIFKMSIPMLYLEFEK